MSKILAVNKNEGTKRFVIESEEEGPPVADAPAEAVTPTPERVRTMSGGRVRYEQEWSPQARVVEDMGRMSLRGGESNTRQSVREGKRREQPARQPRAPSGMGFDGTNDVVEDTSNPQQKVEESSVLTWNSGPVQEDRTWADWKDPEDVQWEEEQKAMRDDSFW